jgi:hypothetical protein
MFGYIIVIVICGVVLIKMIQDIVNGLNSRNWPITQGRVMQSGIHMKSSTDEDGSTSTSYGATVLYTYNVSGEEIRGTRRAFSETRTSSVRRNIWGFRCVGICRWINPQIWNLQSAFKSIIRITQHDQELISYISQ